MRCPRCHRTLLQVSVSFSGKVPCQFRGDGEFRVLDRVAFDSEFRDADECRCMVCGWTGQVAEARRARQQQRRRPQAASADDKTPEPPLKPGELQRISERIAAEGTLPGTLARKLLNEVLRLHSLLDVVARLSEPPGAVPPAKVRPASTADVEVDTTIS